MGYLDNFWGYAKFSTQKKNQFIPFFENSLASGGSPPDPHIGLLFLSTFSSLALKNMHWLSFFYSILFL